MSSRPILALPGEPVLPLLAKVTCPHCWHAFAPEDSLWIAEHPDLTGDAKLGIEHAIRFLPTRFTVDGDARDQGGYRATRMACPHCHLEVPRLFYQLPSLFFSVFGAPACGKSYFLTSMSWKLRQNLPRHFAVSINDADAAANSRLHQYEEQQFLNPDPDRLAAIPKTETQGDLYDRVKMGDHSVSLPRPFMFILQPLAGHPNSDRGKSISRAMSLYDNAGESFLPGADTTVSPVTRHLALSACLFFCFDPTQDPRFRSACMGKSDDPQMTRRSGRLDREGSVRQDTVLVEAIQRVRRHAAIGGDEVHQRPLTFVVTKWDSWHRLLPDVSREEPYIDVAGEPVRRLNQDRIRHVSNQVGDLLRELCPEVVASAEGFASELTFIPISATGHSPELDAQTGSFGIRPRDMKPYWAEVPLLHAINRVSPGLIGSRGRRRSAQGAPA